MRYLNRKCLANLNMYRKFLLIIVMIRYPELRFRMVRHFSFLVLLCVTVLTLDIYTGKLPSSQLDIQIQLDIFQIQGIIYQKVDELYLHA